MIIEFASSTDPKIQSLKERFAEKTDVFIHGRRIAVTGLTTADLTEAERAAVTDIILDHPKAVQSSRALHPEDIVVKTAHSQIDHQSLTLMAGPCSVESKEHVLLMAEAAKKAGATVLRGGAFKPRTSPYSFQGLGEEGLKYLREAADAFDLDVVTEVMDESHVDLVGQYTDIFQIGARNMQNFSLLKAVGQTRIPVMLKRGMSATIDDILNAAEYIAAGGNQQIILVERGIRTFDNKYTRNTLDVGAVPVLRALSPYPVMVDPSHAAGYESLVGPEALAGVAAGAAGLIIEIHDHPDQAFSDGPQALLPKQLEELANQSRAIHSIIRG
ncbi:3-deoxy-7-phosphoheptulonate synthase [Fructobacillus cardui]|uniref:3-deoxy-7-phosphoheptulonate synthase n=1 Tax=Fructobacillus cardui TaxID=2893170 RepID=UPI00200B94C1|nr:3-deoxy-7-phosphoheptulonate synthase [Fructobacillus cardui]MCK8627231.1 3-deoxy-7-phosphoheptulonate synthase [Fructobacillus cardui]